MTEFKDVVTAVKRVESEDDYRFAIRKASDESESTRGISGLKEEIFSVPVAIDLLAYDPQSKTYLGMDRQGVTWRSHERGENSDLVTENEDAELNDSDQSSGTIGKAPVSGAATFLDFFHGRFWCVGSDFQILSSEDGSKWKSQLDRTGVDATHHPGIWTAIIGAQNEEIFAVGLDGIIGVFDGVDWMLDRVDGISFWDAIAIDAETIYACGSNGKIARRVEEDWDIISTPETESFISFAYIGSQVYISTESKLFEFKIRGTHVALNHVGAGGKLFVCDSTLLVLDTAGTLRNFRKESK